MIALEAQLHRFSPEDVDRMVEAGVLQEDDRVELVTGILYDMSPQSSRHAAIVHVALDSIRGCLPADGWHVRVQVPLRLVPDSQPEPDLAVVPGTARSWIERHPDRAALVVEVADTSIDHDRRRKAPLYARAGVSAYWILDLMRDAVEVFDEPDPSACAYRRHTVHARDGSLALPAEIAGAGIEVAVADLLPGRRDRA